jgi:hypothetical protein
MLYLPKPGDIGLTGSKSLTGRIVKAAQALIDDHSFVTHTFIVLYDGWIIEAQPGGASFDRLEKYPDAVFSRFDLTEDQRSDIVVEAIKMHGTPYSFLDYLAIGLAHWKVCPQAIRNRVQSSGHMICSQLCVEAYRRAGVELFPENHLPMDVTPVKLANMVVQHNSHQRRRT